MKWIMCSVLLLIFGAVGAQNFNRPVPTGFPQYEFALADSSYSGYYYFTAKNSADNAALRWLAILDKQGYLVWMSGSTSNQLDFHLHEDHDVFGYTASSPQGAVNHIFLDSTFQALDTIVAPSSYIGDVHERLLLPNGNTAIIVTHDTVVDLSGYTFNGQQGSATTNLASNDILEITPTNTIVFQWHGADHVSPSEYEDGIGNYDAQFFDYMHANAIEVDFDGNFLLSLRHTSSVLKIDRNSGAVIWRLGGNASDFTMTNDNGFSANHFIKSLGNNRYSLYDNGNTTTSPKESRAVIYQLDTVNMTATREWEYKHNPLVYAPAMGSFHQTEQGFSMINWGRVFRPEPTFTLLDSLDNPIVNLYLEDDWVTYRAYASSFPYNFTRPEITCEAQNGSITLTASPSSYYWWNTGEGTQSITVADTGTYVVWTQHGVGYLGSQPYHISDLQNACSTVGIDELEQNDDQLLVIYDLMGREVAQPQTGNIYFLRFTSGQVRKVFWKEGMTRNSF